RIRSGASVCAGARDTAKTTIQQRHISSYRAALYVLLKPFLALVTVKEPSCCADSLIQYAFPLCAGAGAAPGPGAGAGMGAIGIAACWSSIVLAMNIPGTV